MLNSLKKVLHDAATPERAIVSQRFFKTKKGEYGEGDIFIGLTMPKQREIIKNYKSLPFDDLQLLLDNQIHEYRMVALLILNERIKSKSEEAKKEVFDFYVKNFKNINNWDLVDCSCHEVIGRYLFDKDRSVLLEWAEVDHLWTQRIAIVATWHFIKAKQVQDTIALAEIFIHHKHDLIHKATGWMLREAHKKNPTVIENFLENHFRVMPRTTLRYAIERFTLDKKAYFMAK